MVSIYGLHMTCIIPAYANKIYSSRRLSRLLTVEGVEALYNFVEYNFIWKSYGFLPLPPLFREEEGSGAENGVGLTWKLDR
jgi:hypothetical protein